MHISTMRLKEDERGFLLILESKNDYLELNPANLTEVFCKPVLDFIEHARAQLREK